MRRWRASWRLAVKYDAARHAEVRASSSDSRRCRCVRPSSPPNSSAKPVLVEERTTARPTADEIQRRRAEIARLTRSAGILRRRFHRVARPLRLRRRPSSARRNWRRWARKRSSRRRGRAGRRRAGASRAGAERGARSPCWTRAAAARGAGPGLFRSAGGTQHGDAPGDLRPGQPVHPRADGRAVHRVRATTTTTSSCWKTGSPSPSFPGERKTSPTSCSA